MIKNIIIHHSSAPAGNAGINYTLAQCNYDHKQRFNMKSSLGYWIGYHYVIDYSGKITQTRLDTEQGAHCVGYNNSPYDKYSHPERLSIGICLIGNFDFLQPSQAQIKSLTGLLQQKVKEYNIDIKNIVPHRKYSSKSCYGSKLSDDWAQKLLNSSPVSAPPVAETWQDKFNRLMLASGFIIKDGKWKLK